MNETDEDRLQLLDRIADRIPELDLAQHSIECPPPRRRGDAETLLVDGGGIDGGSGIYFANAGDDLHAVGSLSPLAPALDCIVIRPDRSRVLACWTASCGVRFRLCSPMAPEFGVTWFHCVGRDLSRRAARTSVECSPTWLGSLVCPSS